jgi:hypothetical protein
MTYVISEVIDCHIRNIKNVETPTEHFDDYWNTFRFLILFISYVYVMTEKWFEVPANCHRVNIAYDIVALLN